MKVSVWIYRRGRITKWNSEWGNIKMNYEFIIAYHIRSSNPITSSMHFILKWMYNFCIRKYSLSKFSAKVLQPGWDFFSTPGPPQENCLPREMKFFGAQNPSLFPFVLVAGCFSSFGKIVNIYKYLLGIIDLKPSRNFLVAKLFSQLVPLKSS